MNLWLVSVLSDGGSEAAMEECIGLRGSLNGASSRELGILGTSAAAFIVQSEELF